MLAMLKMGIENQVCRHSHQFGQTALPEYKNSIYAYGHILTLSKCIKCIIFCNTQPHLIRFDIV